MRKKDHQEQEIDKRKQKLSRVYREYVIPRVGYIFFINPLTIAMVYIKHFVLFFIYIYDLCPVPPEN